MEWYLPMTIIPGIGLLILSTSNIMLALNTEINELGMASAPNLEIIRSKLGQLKRLSISIVFQYSGVLLFLVAGVLKSILDHMIEIFTGILLSGVMAVGVSIIILLVHSIKAINIRKGTYNDRLLIK